MNACLLVLQGHFVFSLSLEQLFLHGGGIFICSSPQPSVVANRSWLPAACCCAGVKTRHLGCRAVQAFLDFQWLSGRSRCRDTTAGSRTAPFCSAAFVMLRRRRRTRKTHPPPLCTAATALPPPHQPPSRRSGCHTWRESPSAPTSAHPSPAPFCRRWLQSGRCSCQHIRAVRINHPSSVHKDDDGFSAPKHERILRAVPDKVSRRSRLVVPCLRVRERKQILVRAACRAQLSDGTAPATSSPRKLPVSSILHIYIFKTNAWMRRTGRCRPAHRLWQSSQRGSSKACIVCSKAGRPRTALPVAPLSHCSRDTA